MSVGSGIGLGLSLLGLLLIPFGGGVLASIGAIAGAVSAGSQVVSDNTSGTVSDIFGGVAMISGIAGMGMDGAAGIGALGQATKSTAQALEESVPREPHRLELTWPQHGTLDHNGTEPSFALSQASSLGSERAILLAHGAQLPDSMGGVTRAAPSELRFYVNRGDGLTLDLSTVLEGMVEPREVVNIGGRVEDAAFGPNDSLNAFLRSRDLQELVNTFDVDIIHILNETNLSDVLSALERPLWRPGRAPYSTIDVVTCRGLPGTIPRMVRPERREGPFLKGDGWHDSQYIF